MKKITSTQHPLVKHFVKLRNHRGYRYENQKVLVEGPKMIREICRETPAETLFVTDPTIVPIDVQAKEIVVVTDSIIKKVCGTRNPENIIAEVPMPSPASLKGLQKVIALDGVNDPGNMGTLLRTALALGWGGVFILDGSCDPYNDKALRSAKGATFRLPIRFGSWNVLKNLSEENRWHPYLADMKGGSIDNIQPTGPLLLVFGNEAQGASAEANKFCSKIAIPMAGSMESLNVAVAGGIIMYTIQDKGVK